MKLKGRAASQYRAVPVGSTAIHMDPLHEQNKREAFDGMRAYHQSEIAHKGHTVEVIKTLLTVVVSAYGGLVALILGGKVSRCNGVAAAAVFFVCVAIVVFYVVRETNKKIDKDHDSYENHRSEYLAERRLLDIDSAFGNEYTTHWQPRAKDSPTGYSFTKRLTRALGWIVVGAALIGTILAVVASLSQ
jgi:Ca2+/Na+ antiporter